MAGEEPAAHRVPGDDDLPTGDPGPLRPERGVVCPECHSPAPATAGRCPTCGYPLVLAWTDEPAPSPRTPAPVAPGPVEPGPVVPGPVAPGPVEPGPDAGPPPDPYADPYAEPTIVLSGPPVGAVPAPDAFWLAPPPHDPGGGPPTDELPAMASRIPPPPPPPRRDSRGVFVVAGVAAALVVAAVVAVAGLIGGGPDGGSDQPARASRPAASGSGGSPAAGEGTVTVDAAGITAEASSTYEPSKPDYRVANTLDGRLETAWNSDGEKDGRGPGLWLRYTFADPVELRGITIRNGYVRSRKLATAYQANGRLKSVQVITDDGGREWAVEDTPDPQTLRADLGTTTSVEIRVRDVYPGDRFKDLALTEIAFLAAP